MRGTTFRGVRLSGASVQPQPTTRLPALIGILGLLLPIAGLTAPALQQLLQDHRAGVDLVASPRETHTVTLTHVVSTVPGALDVAVVLDASNSFADDLPTIRRLLPPLMSSLADRSDLRVAIVSFQDDVRWGGAPGNYPMRVEVPFTTNLQELEPVLGRMVTRGTNDFPETWPTAVEAVLDDLAWRDGTAITRTAVLVTDATGKHHADGFSGSPAASPDELAERLNARAIRMITLTPRGHDPADAIGLAEATGGSHHKITTNSSDIDAAITDGLANIPVSLTPRLHDPSCPVEQVTVSPDSTPALPAGTHVAITVDFTVVAAATPGIYRCVITTGDSSDLLLTIRVQKTDTRPTKPT